MVNGCNGEGFFSQTFFEGFRENPLGNYFDEVSAMYKHPIGFTKSVKLWMDKLKNIFIVDSLYARIVFLSILQYSGYARKYKAFFAIGSDRERAFCSGDYHTILLT